MADPRPSRKPTRTPRPTGVSDSAPDVVAGTPSADWRALYDAASLVNNLGPWRWMLEDHAFGIQVPGSDRIVFVSVMGAGGDYEAVAVYMGLPEVRHFFAVHDRADESTMMEMIMGTYQLHVAYGAKADLDPSEKSVVSELGVSFRGRHAWPSLTSRRPGYAPYRLEPDEVRILTLALRQLLDVAPRFMDDVALIDPEPWDTGMLVRVSTGDPADPVWVDSRRDCGPYEIPAAGPFTVSDATRTAFRALHPGKGTLEVDLLTVPGRIGERGERCTLPYVLLAADAASGMLVAVDVLTTTSTLAALQAEVPERLLQMLAKNGLRPRRVEVQREWLKQGLDQALAGLGTRVEQSPYLEAVEEARYMLETTVLR